jgi:Flp pilus assembly protein TadD
MRRIITALCSCVVVLACRSAVAPDDALREVAATSRTNLTVALKLSNRLVATHPTSVEALSLRARLLERSRNYDDAILDLNTALKIDPGTPALWQGRG